MFWLISMLTDSRDIPERWQCLIAHITPQMDYALRKAALYIVHDPAAVDDVIRETYIAGVLNCHRLRNEDRLFQWLYTIMKRKSHKYICTQNDRFRPVNLSVLMPMPDSAPSPDDLLIDKEKVEQWKRAFGRFDEATQRILWLRLETDMSLIEIAAAIGINYDTAKSKYHRAKIALLSDCEDGDDDE